MFKRPKYGTSVFDHSYMLYGPTVSVIRVEAIEALETAGISHRDSNRLIAALDEAVANLHRHAYKGRPGPVRLRIFRRGRKVSLHLTDRAPRFNPLSRPAPDYSNAVDTGQSSGFGIDLIRKLSKSVSYRPIRGGNELIMTGKTAESWQEDEIILGASLVSFGIREKFIILICLLILLLMFVVNRIFTARERNALEMELNLRGQALAKNLAAATVNPLTKRDQLQLGSLVKNTVKDNPGVIYVTIVTRKKRIVQAHYGNTQILAGQKYHMPPGIKRLTKETYLIQECTVAGMPVFDVTAPINMQYKNRPFRLGEVHIGLSKAGLETQIQNTQIYIIRVTAISLLIAMICVILLTNMIIRPMRHLIGALKSLDYNNPGQRIRVRSRDEIGLIGSSFNETLHRFDEARSQLVEKERMEKELQVAQEIQQALLPKQIPSVQGFDIGVLYRAAKEVGGDYYDVFRVDKDRLGLVVADVSGKGVPAALVMIMIRSILRIEALGKTRADEVLDMLNRRVQDDIKSKMFVTAFYCILDSVKRTLTFASAGHNPMLLLRPPTGSEFLLNPKGIPLGISMDTGSGTFVTQKQISLKRNDVLLLYTDGITEAMDRYSNQYGDERFRKTAMASSQLPARGIVSEIDNDITRFTQNTPQNDDITLIVVKERESAGDLLFRRLQKAYSLTLEKKHTVESACIASGIPPHMYYRHKEQFTSMSPDAFRAILSHPSEIPNKLTVECEHRILELVREQPDLSARKLREMLLEEGLSASETRLGRINTFLKDQDLNTKIKREHYARREHKRHKSRKKS